VSAARRLIVEAETEGVRIYVRDGKVKVAYRGQPPSDLMVRLRAAKSEIAWELFRQSTTSPDARAGVKALLADMANENERHRGHDAQRHIPERPSKGSEGAFEGFEGEQGERFCPISVPAFDPAALQAEADRRNARALREHSTDRFCACGSLAESGYPDGRGGTVWRCWRCFPILGRA
jgi:hypothetical protein